MGWESNNTFQQVFIVGPNGSLLVYNPSAGPGNLVDSIAAVGITDIPGNAVLAGETSYRQAFAMLFEACQNFGGALTFYTATTEAGPWTAVGVLQPIGPAGTSISLQSISGPLILDAGTSTAVVSPANAAPVTGAVAEIQGDGRAATITEIIPTAAGQHVIGTQLVADTQDRWNVDGNGAENWGPGNAPTDCQVHRLAANSMSVKTADWSVESIGRGYRTAEGANAKQGTATLAGGTILVADTAVTANSRIFLTPQDNNTIGAVRVSARVAGTSFTITSSNATDTGVVAYEIFEPA